ncbi:MAG: hypothetical protein H0X31_18995 [Nostocaceae cyanobacterium]|nr:hypothetical protein [Nostocaceae cyanobacterium]
MIFDRRNGVVDSKYLSSKVVLQALTNTSENDYLSKSATVNGEEMVDVTGIGITAVDLKLIDPMLDSSSRAILSQLFLRNLIIFLQSKIVS